MDVRLPRWSAALAAGLWWLVVPTPPPAGAATVDVPAAIDPTGREDVTTELNTLFAGLAPGTTLSFPAGARYRVEGVLLVLNRRDVTIDGNGATGAKAPPHCASTGETRTTDREHDT